MNQTDFEMINKNRKMIFLFIFIELVIVGGCFFSIRITTYFPSSIIGLFVLLAGNFFVAWMFFGLYSKRPIRVIFYSFLFNALALCWRVLLEWGEYSMTRDLTVFNVTVFLLFIPLYITVVYLIIRRLYNRNQHKLQAD